MELLYLEKEKPPLILVVDDVEAHLELIEAALTTERYRVEATTNVEKAIRFTETHSPELAILDVMMPGMNGYELCKRLKSTFRRKFFPIILVTSLNQVEDKIAGLEAGADDFFSKPFNTLELITKISFLIKLERLQDELECSEDIIFALAITIEAKDYYTKGHSERVGNLSAEFAGFLGFPDKDIISIRKGGILHDIGKIGINEAILLQKTFGGLTERQQRYLNTIFGSAKHLLYLGNNILDLAKIETGKSEISYQAFPVKSVIDEVLVVIRPLAERKMIVPETVIHHDIHFTANKIKFKQILYNLISNAIKFTADSGKAGIAIEKIISDKKNFPLVTESQEFLKVSVWDTGMGIKPEDRERIFEEFEQIDSSKSTEGTGLGLSLTKKLVEIHGGHITVEGSYRQGSVFNVYMPFIVREEYGVVKAPMTSLTALPEEEQQGYLILVVEDDLPTAEILAIHLTQAGCRTAHAYDGEEALRKAKELKPFAITLDIILPKKDGLAVLQELKADAATRNIPVIIHSIVENKELAFALEAADYLVKPVEKAKLIEKLSEMSFVSKKSRFPVNILVITSDETTLETLRSTIENEGFLMQTAADVESGLSLALATKPNSIIIDLGIQEGGFKIIREFQENPVLKYSPIFAIAAETLSPNERLEGVMSGFVQRSKFLNTKVCKAV